jgi:RIO kinase 1
LHPDNHKEESLVKQRFESNADVQRWLKTQIDLNRPDFSPAFLREHRDRDWILSSLASFYNANQITDVLRELKSGKEATVFLCRAHPDTDREFLAAKIYRPRIFRSLKNDAVYRNNRNAVSDRRLDKAIRKNTRLGKALRVDSWIRYEYQTHRTVYEAGCDVPEPIGRYGNAVLMEYVGEGSRPAPTLHEIALPPDEARNLLDRIIENIRLFLSCNRIHGDLSSFNILYWNGEMKIIDFAQAVDARSEPDIYPLLLRDIDRIGRYFTRLGLKVEANSLATDLWSQYIRGNLW